MADMLLAFSAIRSWVQMFFGLVMDNWLLQIPFALMLIYLVVHVIIKFLPEDDK